MSAALVSQAMRHELAKRMEAMDHTGLPVVCGRLVAAVERMSEIERTQRFLEKLEKMAERKNFGYRQKSITEGARVKYVALAVALWRAYADARDRLQALRGGAL